MIRGEQLRVLLGPVNTRFVKRDPGGHSYLEQNTIRAQLTRIFGFGGWSLRQLHEPRLISRTEHQNRNGEDRVTVVYLCSVAIVLHTRKEMLSGTMPHDIEYAGVATGKGTMSPSNEGDAHDVALKSADSGALKRAAINMGDQFGLSLYDDGSTAPYVFKVWDGEQFVTQKDLTTEGDEPVEDADE